MGICRARLTNCPGALTKCLALIMSRIDYCNSAHGRPAADNDRTTAASAERSGSPAGVRTRAEGACYSKPSPAALASSLLAGPVQVVLYHALDLSWQLAGVSDEYRSFCRCQPIPFRSPVGTFHQLRTASPTDQIRRACFLTYW